MNSRMNAEVVKLEKFEYLAQNQKLLNSQEKDETPWLNLNVLTNKIKQGTSTLLIKIWWNFFFHLDWKFWQVDLIWDISALVE